MDGLTFSTPQAPGEAAVPAGYKEQLRGFGPQHLYIMQENTSFISLHIAGGCVSTLISLHTLLTLKHLTTHSHTKSNFTLALTATATGTNASAWLYSFLNSPSRLLKDATEFLDIQSWN